jgi:hypothetical protein
VIKGVHMVRIKRGSRPPCWYIYAWRGGPLILKREGKTKPILLAGEVRAILDACNQQRDRHAEDNSLRSMIRAYRSRDPNRPSSPEWEKLSAGTKKTWGSALDLIEQKWGQTPLTIWNEPRMKAKVVGWRDSRSKTPRGADIGITVLGALLKFGMLRGLVEINVASGIPSLYRNGARAEIIWTNDDIDRFVAKAHELGRPQIADGLRLAALTGLRRADLVSLTWDNVSEFAVEKLALKRSAGKRRHMMMPRIPALGSLLDELRTRHRKPGVQTVLTTSYGEPWTGDGFGGSFNRIRDEADIAHVDPETGVSARKHLHDVRGTFCTRLIVDAGLNDIEVAGIMGWAPEKVAAIRHVYVDQSRVVVALGERLRNLK